MGGGADGLMADGRRGEGADGWRGGWVEGRMGGGADGWRGGWVMIFDVHHLGMP